MTTTKDNNNNMSDTAAATVVTDGTTSIDNDNTDTAAPPLFVTSKHVDYVSNLAQQLEGTFEGALTNHLRMSGVYWSVACMFVLVSQCDIDTDADAATIAKVDAKMGLLPSTNDDQSSNSSSIIDWIDTCFHETTGGYGGDTGQEAHILYTLSALQILAMADCMDVVSKKRTDQLVTFIASLQQLDGSFVGDAAGGGEVDTRFSYCALSALSLLGRLNYTDSHSPCPSIDLEKAVSYIQACANPLDGGYGSCIGAESHAGQVFCCIGALSIAHALPSTPNKLQWWLSERQCDAGGLNGRSEKQADVCYSWWLLSVMSILGMVHFIDTTKLKNFILKAQDLEDGGIADRPDDMADVFHTFFGVAGLSLLNSSTAGGDADEKTTTRATTMMIDPVYALPVSTVRRMGLTAQVVSVQGRAVDPRLEDLYTTNNMTIVEQEQPAQEE
eukprot:CAMPEP_0119015204 /NCGR_PEP_ID=MMETSP1176-20130426/10612_1 /TAXON_ID=265551 /ORGANISM="Synedropsis recta cf, Strain CCMP1620" /LENGTH=442 /DNA_ID=CAMNT_0006968477 /DNA_START=46 /DNA_END=1374 /DNA_ORIENTATION=-